MKLFESVLIRAAAARVVAVVVVVLLGVSGLALLTAAPAHAASRITAVSSLGGAVASASGPTTFTVSGSGFQAIDGGFGGVYVGFGWVNGSGWGPSNGGATGNSYDYVPDEQSKSNKGYQAFVAFPGSSTAGESQGTMGSDGSFRVQLTVPGPTFTGAGGKRIDCLKMTCGFLTWGAHGVRNGANETFTPVTFQAAAPATGGATAAEGAAPGDSAPAQSATGQAGTARSGRAAGTGRAAGAANTTAGTAGSGAAQPGQESASPPGDEAGNPPSAPEGEPGAAAQPVDALDRPTVSGAAVVEVDRRAARPGGAMGFAAAGFWPGEQVYVVLGEGDAAVGPVVAGVDGEVAGVMVLPETMEAGTHEIRAAGAGSGLEAVERFPVRADIATAASSTPTGLAGSLKWIFLALSALALLAMTAVVVKRRQADGLETDDDYENYGDGGDSGDSGDAHLSDGLRDASGSTAPPLLSDPEQSPYAGSTATPFPHPAMAGRTTQNTSAFEKEDQR